MFPSRDPFAPKQLPRWSLWALVGLSVLGLLARLWMAWRAPWYWDEGYVADIAQALARFQRPYSGAFWANGLLPLTASWLAPVTAVPFMWLSSGQAILGLRVWAALLGALSCFGLGLLGRRLGGWSLGLLAAGLLALGPFCVSLGGLGLYHALGTLLGVAAFGLALEQTEGGGDPWSHAPWALAGFAVVACYWLWWIPLGLLLRFREKGVKAWMGALALGFGLPALALLLSLNSPGGVEMFRGLNGYHAGLQPWPVYWASLGAYPFIWAGVLGLGLLGRRRAWLIVAVAIGLADLLRQRGSLQGSPYILLPILPWAALGLAATAQWVGKRHWTLGLVVVAISMLSLSFGDLAWINRLSVAPPMVRNLRNYIRSRHLEGRTVITTPNVGIALETVCQPADLSQVVAWRGLPYGYIPGQLPRSAFKFDPALDSAALLVVGRAHFECLFLSQNAALEALRAEYAGWPLVFANPEFKVYANPTVEGRRDPQVRILQDSVFYDLARRDAQTLGLTRLVRFAQRRSEGHKAPI